MQNPHRLRVGEEVRIIWLEPMDRRTHEHDKLLKHVGKVSTISSLEVPDLTHYSREDITPERASFTQATLKGIPTFKFSVCWLERVNPNAPDPLVVIRRSN